MVIKKGTSWNAQRKSEWALPIVSKEKNQNYLNHRVKTESHEASQLYLNELFIFLFIFFNLYLKINICSIIFMQGLTGRAKEAQ